MTQQRSPRAEPNATLSEAELSRIAREAVHQPADPRLDRQLARMGVMDPPEPARTPVELARPTVTADPALERIEARLRRAEMLLGIVLVGVGLTAVVSLALLLR